MNATRVNVAGNNNMAEAKDALLSARAAGVRLAMGLVRDQDAVYELRLAAAAVLNGVDDDGLRKMSDEGGWR